MITLKLVLFAALLGQQAAPVPEPNAKPAAKSQSKAADSDALARMRRRAQSLILLAGAGAASESVPLQDQPSWHYGFARLGAAQLQATLNDDIVWRRAGVVRWDPTEPCYSRFGPDGAVFPETIDAEPNP
jgi:hypothetical protein